MLFIVFEDRRNPIFVPCLIVSPENRSYGTNRIDKLIFISQIMGLVSKINRKPPKLKTDIIKRLQQNYWYDSSKAEQEFGIKFRPIKDTVDDTVKWFQSAEFRN